MRSSLLAFIFCFAFIQVPAQQTAIDSLLQALQMHPQEDTLKVDVLNNIAYEYYQVNPDKGISYGIMATVISEKLKDEFRLATSYHSRGLNHAEKGDYMAALDLYKKAAEILEKQNKAQRLFHIRNSTAIIHMQLSQFSSALQLHFKNLAMCEKEDLKKGAAVAAGNISLVYEKMGNHDEAFVYNQKAIDIQTKRGDEKAIADLLNSRGNIYDGMDDFEKAADLYRQSLLRCKKLNYIKGIAGANANLGNVYNEMGKYDSAFYFIKSSLDVYEEMGDKLNLAMSLSYTGKIISKASTGELQKNGIPAANRYAVANEYFNRSILLNKELGNIVNEAENWKDLSSNYKQMGVFDKALEANENYILLYDSVLNDKTITKIKKQEIEFATRIKEDSLTLVQQKKDIQAATEIGRQSALKKAVAWGSGILFFAALVSFIFYKKRRDAKQKQQEAEFRSEVAGTEMKALRAQMNPHFIFNSLNSISDYITKNDVQQADRYLTKFAKLMRMILENSEQKDVPLADDLKALELYMQLEALRMNNKFSYEIRVDADVDKEATMVPPLILQPFVENSIWHGIAKKEGTGKILIHIKKEGGDMINCIVEDDGVGRKQSALVKPTAAQAEKTSLGMKITQARIDILNKIKNTKAAVQLSDLEHGVRVEVRLPLATVF